MPAGMTDLQRKISVKGKELWDLLDPVLFGLN